MKQMLEISVWRHRDLRLVTVGRAASFLGDEVAVIALTLYAYDAGWGAPGVAAVLIAAGLPFALGAPFAGRVVDRVDSRRVTAAAALWQGACALVAVVVLSAGDARSVATVVALLVLVAAMSAGQTVSGPAWQALVVRIVPADEVSRAVALLQSTTMLAGVAGPAVGGLLVASGGVAGALVVDAVSFAVLAAVACAVRTVRRPAPSVGDGGAWAGFALLRHDRVLGTLVGGLVVMVLVLQVVVVLEVLLVRGSLGGGPMALGVVSALFAAAMVVGAVVAGRWSTARSQLAVILGSVPLIAGCVVLGGLASELALFAAAVAGIGLGNGLLNVAFGAFLVGRAPDAVRGRLFAAVTGATESASVAGLAVGGVVGGLVDVRAAWVVAGAIGLGVSGVMIGIVAPGLLAMTNGKTLESHELTGRGMSDPAGTGDICGWPRTASGGTATCGSPSSENRSPISGTTSPPSR